ncbi:hypothetical protein ACFOEP_00805 [Microbacterium amylolyticum]|uniref:hypothetical protein n=1 Tax=Microbacterium amylolyticum TaxID=936337 RepID=UPI003612BD32
MADQGRIRRLIGMGFALVVLAIRRGSHLATAMESRAFGADTARSWARESRWGGGEWLLMAAGVVISATAITVSVQTGWYNPIFGR